MNPSLTYLCQLLFDVHKVPVYLLNQDLQITYSMSQPHLENPLGKEPPSSFLPWLRDIKGKEPAICSGDYNENYLICLVNDSDDTHWIVLGPSLPFRYYPNQVDDLMNRLRLPLHKKKSLLTYLNGLQLLDYNRLIGMSQMLYFTLYHETLDKAGILEKSSSMIHKSSELQQEYLVTTSNNRLQAFYHHSLESEKQMLKCVREGNTDQLKAITSASIDGEYGVLSKDNPIRSEQNLSICMVTLVTRAAIEGGLDTERALTLSDLYIQEIETLHTVKDLLLLRNRMIQDFTTHVRKVKESAYSKQISHSIQMIHQHLYDDLQLHELSAAVGLSPHYFAERFKKEVGLPVMTFIRHEKIKEAQFLLASTSYSILEISNMLTFHDQSHFTKAFDKCVGLTPGKYRESLNTR